MKKTKPILIVLGIAVLVIAGIWFTKPYKKAQVESISVSQKEDLLATLSNNGGGVEVSVTPKSLSEELAFWDFDVQFDTHSVELSDDVALVSFLIDEAGKRYEAVSWEGDPPGGHHRTGTLRFERISPSPKAVMLKIEGIGGVSERIFSWEL